MNVIGLLFLIITEFVAGRALLYIFNVKEKPVSSFMISMLCGILVVSIVPFILALCHIQLTESSMYVSVSVATIVLAVTQIKKFMNFKVDLWGAIKSVQLYELPVIIICILMMGVSVWRCFYYPPFARDMNSGPEAIAEFAVREKTMINSIFSLNLESTNNHLKPPFITDLQIVYKILVQPFGQVWLSQIAICFLIWIYNIMRDKLHPLFASMVFLVFFTMPDPFSYTYIMLFDYSNMVFYFAGFYFIMRYVDTKTYNYFLFSVLMFGFATYIRPETLVLCGLALPLVIWYQWKDKVAIPRIVISSVIFMIIPFIFYYLWMGIFMKYYMPVHFDVADRINKNLTDLSPFYNRFYELNTRILFEDLLHDIDPPKPPLQSYYLNNGIGLNIALYGYFIYMFIVILITDLIFFRKKFTTEGRIALYGVLTVYIGLPLLGYLIPWVDLMNTTKRGLFKMFPLMLIYMRSSGFLIMLSNGIRNWEMPSLTASKPQPVQVKQATPKPQPKGKK